MYSCNVSIYETNNNNVIQKRNKFILQCSTNLTLRKKENKAEIMAHAFNPCIWEVQARGSRVQSQPQLHSEFKPTWHT